ncbi:MAG: phosphoglycerate dehydrogenase [Bacteroidetes bacterium B1(2017)]|nr:MAG: phosphoglycerate dehydrogenase [Bacteroidetes bacterium B1(2017)]
MNIIIVDDVHELLIEGLSEVGHNVLYLPNATRQDILAHLPGMHVLVIRTKTQVDKEVLRIGSDLKIVARAGAGLDNIDLEEAEAKGIYCINAGEANSDAVGEHALGLLLMLFNNLGRAHNEVKEGIWLREENRGIELAGKTVAIIGYGNTGSAFARKLSGMGVKILAYDKYVSGFGNEMVKESTWEEIYTQADVLSFHVPLTTETTYYLDEARIEKFKKKFWLLNLSRGKVVKTKSVIEAIKNEKIAGCALDVLENENLKNLNMDEKEDFMFMARHKKVILTPHIGGWTKESYHKISSVLLDKLLTFSPKN